jgi:SAM-dependent methyltransferase
VWGRGRYNAVGGLYDLVSLEPLLYRRPRRDLLHQLDLQPGDTVLDLGCGNGLNFADVSASVGPCGRIVGVDASTSMLAAAQRRTQKAGWRNVSLINGDLLTLAEVLHRAQIDTAQVDAIIATFALSLLERTDEVWAVIDQRSAVRPVRIGIADIGDPTGAVAPLRPAYRALAPLGGADPHRVPWDDLILRDASTTHLTYFGGHVHTSTATLAPLSQRPGK